MAAGARCAFSFWGARGCFRVGGEPFRVVPGAAVPGCESVAPASLSPVLLVSDRPSVSFGEWQRGSPCKGSFFSGAGPGRGKLAGGWGVRAAGSPRRCRPPHPSAGLFGGPRAGARAGMAFFRSSTEGARGPAAGDWTGSVGRGTRGGGGSELVEIAMCSTAHILSGSEDRSSGRRALRSSGLPPCQGCATIVIFSHFVPPGWTCVLSLIRHGILLRAFSPPEPKKPQTTDAHTQRIAVTPQLGFCAVVYSI